MNLSTLQLAKENRRSEAKLHVSEVNTDADYVRTIIGQTRVQGILRRGPPPNGMYASCI
jgi:hypothetical protein